MLSIATYWYHQLDKFQAYTKTNLRSVLSVTCLSLTACGQSPSTANDPMAMADALIPPDQPSLTLTASPGQLVLNWQVAKHAGNTKIYHFDSFTQEEALLAEIEDPSTRTWQLPSTTHLRAWHREQLRIEICHVTNCISSARVPVIDLAQHTVELLIPPIFVSGETFGAAIALNDNATILAASLSEQQAVQLFMRINNRWQSSQLIKLGTHDIHTAPPSLDLSTTGDTLAVLETFSNYSQLSIFERLGESWVATKTRHITNPQPATTLDSQSIQPTVILSASGDKSLAVTKHGLHYIEQLDDQWTHLEFATHSFVTSPQEAFTTNFFTQSNRLAATTNSDLTAVFTVDNYNGQLWLSRWGTTDFDESNREWIKLQAFQITGLNSNAQILARSNSLGTQLLIAGWEDIGSVESAPVMWHLALPSHTDTPTSSTASLSVVGSIRFKPTQHTDAQLSFDADQQLSTIAIGWQSNEGAQAQLSTYRLVEPGQWLPFFEAPEAISTLAKQNFLKSVALSASGEGMVTTLAERLPLSGTIPINQIITFR